MKFLVRGFVETEETTMFFDELIQKWEVFILEYNINDHEDVVQELHVKVFESLKGKTFQIDNIFKNEAFKGGYYSEEIYTNRMHGCTMGYETDYFKNLLEKYGKKEVDQ